jgi:hypothetical protein
MATNIIANSKEDIISIDHKIPYECFVVDPQDSLQVFIYDQPSSKLIAKGQTKIFSKFAKQLDSNRSFVTNVPIKDSETKEVYLVGLEKELKLSLQMCEQVVKSQIDVLNLNEEQLDMELSSLSKDILTISHAFSRVGFNENQSGFYMDTEEKKHKENRSRCDCCIIM